jgi:hypothetical protein
MDHADELQSVEVVDPEIRQLLGLFDIPAFARRGQDLEQGLERFDSRLHRRRMHYLEMVHLRLRQWAAAVEGPQACEPVFVEPIAPLWPLTGAGEPVWGTKPVPHRKRRAIGRDLVQSITRFNRRWTAAIDDCNLEPINDLIDQYNRYYVLEKECMMGSVRLAARHFVLQPRMTPEALLARYPLLPVPRLRA